MIYMGYRGSSHFAFTQLILVVYLRRGRLFSHRGHSSVHCLQPLVQFISLAEVEPDSLFLSLALQTVTDTLLEQSTATAVCVGFFFKDMLAKTSNVTKQTSETTSSSCRFPVAFIWIVAILSASTAREECMASWSAMSESMEFEARSSVKLLCSLFMSSCTVWISSDRC